MFEKERESGVYTWDVADSNFPSGYVPTILAFKSVEAYVHHILTFIFYVQNLL
jgi:hypothetical protein